MIGKTAVALFLTVVLAVPFVFSQMGPGGGRGRGGRNYDKATEMTVKGTVEDVMQTTGKNGWSGTHLKLKSDQGTFDVHVGPSAYISSQQFSFAKGDTIEVLGSKVTMRGQEVLLARKITKDGKVLTLRNEQGVPVWSGAASSRQ